MFRYIKKMAGAMWTGLKKIPITTQPVDVQAHAGDYGASSGAPKFSPYFNGRTDYSPISPSGLSSGDSSFSLFS